MTNLTLHPDFIRSGYTNVDNVFFSSYLPTADPTDVKVYLYGLYLVSSGNSEAATVENLAVSLKLTEERVREAFSYWENEGLIAVSSDAPVRLSFMPVKNPLPRAKKFDVTKYSFFVEDAVRLFHDRVLTPNELYAYEELMHFSGLEPNALLMIMQYCKNVKDKNVGAPYILAVANDWIKSGFLTEESVNEHIEELESNGDSIRQILNALGVKSAGDLNSREFFVKWSGWGYDLSAILTAARLLKKRGGMTRLDKLMTELRDAKAFTAQEIAEYWKDRQNTFDTAEGVVKGIGGFYASLDVVVETYIKPWLALGFSHEGLLLIAKLCFLSDIKSLDGVNDQINRLFKQGVVTDEALSDYIRNRLTLDSDVKEVFELAGLNRKVVQSDREQYTLWAGAWGIPTSTIRLAASMVRGMNFAMSKINNMMLAVKNNPTVTDAEARTVFQTVLKGENAAKKHQPMLTRETIGDDLPPVFDVNTEV